MSSDLSGAASGTAAPAAGRGGRPSLEYSQNVVTDGQQFEIARCGCDCWYCGDCCKRKGYNLRAELIPALGRFKGLMMLTLTVDPGLFECARAAYLYVREQRAISRLMQDLHRGEHLHSRRYFYVVEFQRSTEHAHFHVLIDASFVPKPAIDASWSKLRPSGAPPVAANRPTFGMTRFSVSRFKGGAEHAGRYATKYLTKVPEYGWPAWVLSMGGKTRLPRYGTSRGFWGRDRKKSNPTGKTRESKAYTYADRIAECGTSCNVFECRSRVDQATGELLPSRNWLLRVGVELSRLVGLAGEPIGPRRIRLKARDLAQCIGDIQSAAGHPVRVLARAAAPGGAR
jgi:hypothetical protein